MGANCVVVLVVRIAGGIVNFPVLPSGIRKGKVLEALGPDSEITSIRVGCGSVDVEGPQIKGLRGWPAGR